MDAATTRELGAPGYWLARAPHRLPVAAVTLTLLLLACRDPRDAFEHLAAVRPAAADQPAEPTEEEAGGSELRVAPEPSAPAADEAEEEETEAEPAAAPVPEQEGLQAHKSRLLGRWGVDLEALRASPEFSRLAEATRKLVEPMFSKMVLEFNNDTLSISGLGQPKHSPWSITAVDGDLITVVDGDLITVEATEDTRSQRMTFQVDGERLIMRKGKDPFRLIFHRLPAEAAPAP